MTTDPAITAGELICMLTDIPLSSGALVLMETETGSIVKLGSARIELTVDSEPRVVLEPKP